MTKSEKRFIRREWISAFLHKKHNLNEIKYLTRYVERLAFHEELKAYA